jgi:uncharacterized damage-inducible protein DinB
MKKQAKRTAPAREPAAGPVARPVPAKRRGRKPPVDLGRALREAFATGERMNQFLLERLEPGLWQASPPNTKPGTGRTIAAIFAHLHNVRHMWLTVSAKDLGTAPEKVDRKALGIEGAKAALAASASAMDALLARALAEGGHVRDFKPDVVGFVAYALSHEAHHRGQVCLLARALGHPFEQDTNFGLWDWRKRHAEIAPLPEAEAEPHEESDE